MNFRLIEKLILYQANNISPLLFIFNNYDVQFLGTALTRLYPDIIKPG